MEEKTEENWREKFDKIIKEANEPEGEKRKQKYEDLSVIQARDNFQAMLDQEEEEKKNNPEDVSSPQQESPTAPEPAVKKAPRKRMAAKNHVILLQNEESYYRFLRCKLMYSEKTGHRLSGEEFINELLGMIERKFSR